MTFALSAAAMIFAEFHLRARMGSVADFDLSGRSVSLEPSEPESPWFRILVDGVPVPMEVTKTKSSVHTPRTARFEFSKPIAEVYNTSIWRSEFVLLEFDEDFSRVAATWDDWIDATT